MSPGRAGVEGDVVEPGALTTAKGELVGVHPVAGSQAICSGMNSVVIR